MIRVGVNGYGTIGKRIADAVLLQDDMRLVGVAKRRPDYEAFVAKRAGIPLYAIDEESFKAMEDSGLEPKGILSELLDKVDVIVDSTPAGVGASFKEMYSDKRVKAVFQGGEAPDVAEVSFSTLCNYLDAFLKTSVRVVSCNTTGILRIACSLHNELGVKRVNTFIVRRGADPKEYKKGPINSVIISPTGAASHHGKDAKSVLHDVDFHTKAVVVPTNNMHVHFIEVKFREKITREKVIEALSRAPRILLIDAKRTGIVSTSQVIEYFRDLGRKRADVPELVVWQDSIHVDNDVLSLVQAVHQESIVVPENIDAIRALAGTSSDATDTIRRTDNKLGLMKRIE